MKYSASKKDNAKAPQKRSARRPRGCIKPDYCIELECATTQDFNPAITVATKSSSIDCENIT